MTIKSVQSKNPFPFLLCQQAGMIQTGYNIVKAHAGKFFMESEEGVGTTFIITLPFKINQ